MVLNIAVLYFQSREYIRILMRMRFTLLLCSLVLLMVSSPSKSETILEKWEVNNKLDILVVFSSLYEIQSKIKSATNQRNVKGLEAATRKSL